MSERFRLEEGWSAPVLLIGMLLSVALAIQAAGWTDGLQALRLVAVVSIVAGLLLARSRFSPAFAHLLSFVYGSFTIGYLMGSQPTIMAKDWHGRIVELIIRLSTWANKALTGGQSRDALMFVVLMSIIIWLLGYNAAWHTFRHRQVWLAILPIGAVLFLCLYYYYGPVSLTAYLFLYILCALLFTVRSHLTFREQQWRLARVSFDPGIRLEILGAGFAFSMLALLVASQTPTAEASRYVSEKWQRVGGPWRVVQDEWSRLFSALKSYSQGNTDLYGRALSLGGPVQLGDTLVMDVIIPQMPNTRFYWRAVTYDKFDGARWTDTSADQQAFDPNADITVADYSERKDITQTITTYLPASNLVYMAPQPLWVGLDATATFNKLANGQEDLSMLRSNITLRPGDTYQAVSSVTVADEASLRAAGSTYPQSIQDRYLQIPSSTTQRTRDLAQKIVEGQTTAFDKAIAIQNWLRSNITYNQNISAPPDQSDAVDYVLFDSKQGYCNYYASSMVIMLRTLGIPARMAVGYAQGKWEPKINGYRVLERDAHSWVEAYFPRYGWVEFEPTASQTVIARPPGDPAAAAAAEAEQKNPDQNGNQADPSKGDPNPPDRKLSQKERDRLLNREEIENGSPLNSGPLTIPYRPNWTAMTLGVLLVLGLVTITVLAWVVERRGLAGLSLTSQNYARLLRYAQWLGLPVGLAETPYERAEALVAIVPDGQQPIYSITDQYVQEAFARRQAGVDAGREWNRLRPVLLRGALRRSLEQFRTLPRKFRK